MSHDHLITIILIHHDHPPHSLCLVTFSPWRTFAQNFGELNAWWSWEAYSAIMVNHATNHAINHYVDGQPWRISQGHHLPSIFTTNQFLIIINHYEPLTMAYNHQPVIEINNNGWWSLIQMSWWSCCTSLHNQPSLLVISRGLHGLHECRFPSNPQSRISGYISGCDSMIFDWWQW